MVSSAIEIDRGSGERWTTRIPGDVHELSALRRTIAGWLTEIGVDGNARDGLVLAVHEVAAQAIERGAEEVVVQGDSTDGTILLSVAGGDWSTVDDLRTRMLEAAATEVRLHRGVVGLRLDLTED